MIEGRAKLAPVYVPWRPYISEEQHKRRRKPLPRFLSPIRRHFRQILSFVVVCATLTFIVSKRLTPIYESTALLDVDRQSPESRPAAAQRQSPDGMNLFLATQIRLVQSDSVLRPIALKFKLSDREQRKTGSATRRPVARAEAPIHLKSLKVTRLPNTYLLQISYSSANPRAAAEIANAVAAGYIENSYDARIRLSAGFSSFAQKQLDALKEKVEKSRLALTEFERDAKLPMSDQQTNRLGARLARLNAEYTKLQTSRVVKQFQLQNQPSHHRKTVPKRLEREYARAVNRQRVLGRQVEDTKAKLDKINARSLEHKSLERQANADRKAYEELAQSVSEAGRNSRFPGETIRLVDIARPEITPVSPRVGLNVLLVCLFASIVGIAVASLSDFFDQSVRDAEQAHKRFDADVIGMLPMARSNKSLFSFAPVRTSHLIHWHNSSDNTTAEYVEAIRFLRNSIALGTTDRRPKSILIASTAPREGRTSTAVHLALAHAEQRRKTLLIDCDLRASSIHRYFDVSNSVGISNVITEGMPWRDAVARVDDTPELHLLLSGPFARRAPDLVGGEIASIIAESGKEYDLIVIDSPPMFGLAEPLQIATHVGGVVIVTVAGKTDSRAVLSLLNTFNRLRIPVAGIVLNKVPLKTAATYDYCRYYGRDTHARQG